MGGTLLQQLILQNNNWPKLIQDKLYQWWVVCIRMVPNLVAAILVLLLSLVIARLVRKLSKTLFLKLFKSASVSDLFCSILYFAIFCTGFFTALDILKLDKAVTSLLAGAGIIGLALGFAFQDLTANFISGVFMAFKRPFDVGDTIETNNFLGEIETIELRSTTMKTYQGLHLIIPNKNIFQNPIINHSRTLYRRIDIDFQVGINEDISRLQEVILSSLATLDSRKDKRGVEWYFTDMDQNNLKVRVSVWIDNNEPLEALKFKHLAIAAILKGLRDHKMVLK